MNKGGQVTIFIIVALIAIGLVALFFLINKGVVSEPGENPETNPNAFLASCIEDPIKEGINLIALHGGYVSNPLNKTFKFEQENSATDIAYLCYNQNYYSSCVNQEPMLLNHLEQEIHDYISENVAGCFNKLKTSLEKAGYTIEEAYRGFEANLEKGEIILSIDGEINLAKSGETKKMENFKIITASRLDELGNMVQEIVNSEATIGEFSHYQIFEYPEFDINKYRNDDSSIIYTVQHIKSKEEFRFAVRGAVIKSGWFK